MSNDTGVSVKFNKDSKKWQVLNINMSSEFESLESEHDTRAEAIDAAAEAAQWPVEYGIVHIDAEDVVSDLELKDQEASND